MSDDGGKSGNENENANENENENDEEEIDEEEMEEMEEAEQPTTPNQHPTDTQLSPHLRIKDNELLGARLSHISMGSNSTNTSVFMPGNTQRYNHIKLPSNSQYSDLSVANPFPNINNNNNDSHILHKTTLHQQNLQSLNEENSFLTADIENITSQRINSIRSQNTIEDGGSPEMLGIMDSGRSDGGGSGGDGGGGGSGGSVGGGVTGQDDGSGEIDGVSVGGGVGSVRSVGSDGGGGKRVRFEENENKNKNKNKNKNDNDEIRQQQQQQQHPFETISLDAGSMDRKRTISRTVARNESSNRQRVHTKTPSVSDVFTLTEHSAISNEYSVEQSFGSYVSMGALQRYESEKS